MKVGLVALVVFVILRAEMSRARADTDTPPVISIHPGVATILYLPDDIVHTWVEHSGEIQVAPSGNKLYVRPHAGTPAGVEASLEVETSTVHQTFQLRVVAHARDANRDVPVLPGKARAPDEPAPEPSSEVPAEPAPPSPIVLAPEAPAASTSTDAPDTRPAVSPEPTEKPADSLADPVPTTLGSPEISVHAIGSLGFTSLDVTGYAPFVARQSHLGFGVRLRVARPDAWWAVEANVMGERPSGAVTFGGNDSLRSELALNGPWLRAEVGMRARFGTKWSPSAYAGLGVQAHLRQTEGARAAPAFSETMPRGAVLVLGIGLQRRAGDLLLGLDFQVREGGPDGYHSAALLWTIGCNLDPD